MLRVGFGARGSEFIGQDEEGGKAVVRRNVMQRESCGVCEEFRVHNG
jgi:hypothetical protein